MIRLAKVLLCLCTINVAALSVAHAAVFPIDEMPPATEVEQAHTNKHSDHKHQQADFCDMAVGHCGAYTVPHNNPADEALYNETLSILLINEQARSKYHPDLELRPPRV